jgi:two-component system OmpR family response regulator
MRLLLAEDDPMIGDGVRRGLAQDGFAVDWVRDGRAAELALAENVHDLVLLDLGLPRKDGLEVLLTMRRKGDKRPVLVLTARDAVADRVAGLDAGADDYLVKPFAFSELVARVNAILRRPPITTVATILRVGDLEMDLVARTVAREGRRIELQAREFKLLEYLMRHAGQIVTRTMLLEHVWEFHFDPKTTIVETHLSRLRAKVDRDFAVELIQTVRGSGYMIREPV